MAAGAPLARALFERLIVTRLVLLDQTLQADVAAHFVAQMVALQEQQEPGYPPVAVPKRVNAEIIEVKGGQRDQWMNPGFVETAPPMLDQFGYCAGRFSGGDGTETDAFATIGIPFDDVAVPLLVLAGIPDFTPSQTVQVADRGFGDGQMDVLFVDQRECVPVAPDFFLIAVAEQGCSEHQLAHSSRLDGDALDAVAGYRAFDQGMFAQGFEPLRCLTGVKGLLATKFAQVGQIPARAAWNRGIASGKPAQGIHGSVESANGGISSRFNSMDALKNRPSKSWSLTASSVPMDAVRG